jgi:recombination protein RecT
MNKGNDSTVNAQHKTVATINPEQLVRDVGPEFQRLAAIHNSVNWDAESNYAIQQIYKSSFAASTAVNNPVSVQNAVRNIAAIGLSLNPALQYAYLVPRDKSICLDISYKGLMHLALLTGSVVWAQCKLVHENDKYMNAGASVEPRHEYNAFGDRGAIVGAYCVVKLPNNDFLTHEMSIDDIYAIRNRSMAYKKNSGPWVTDEKQMIKKTVVKQASSYWPKVERMNEAIKIINDGGEGIDFEAERKEAVTASSDYQFSQLLVGHMSNDDGEGLLDAWESVDSEEQEKAWRHLGAPERRKIKELLKSEREQRTIEHNEEEK